MSNAMNTVVNIKVGQPIESRDFSANKYPQKEVKQYYKIQLYL